MFNERKSTEVGRSSGFTLVEILIALLMGSIFATAVFTLFKSQSDSYLKDEQRIEAMQNARAAMEMISRDIRNAGLFIGSFEPQDVFELGAFEVPLPDGTTKILKAEDGAIQIRTFDISKGVTIQEIHGGSQKVYICEDDTLDPGDLIVAMDNYRDNFEPRVLTREKENKNCSGCPKKGCDSLDYKSGKKYSKYNTGALGTAFEGGLIVPMSTIYYYVEPEFTKEAGEDVPALMRFETGDEGGPSVVAYHIESIAITYMDGNGNRISSNSDQIRRAKISVNARTRDPLPTGQGNFPFARYLTSEVKIRNLGL